MPTCPMCRKCVRVVITQETTTYACGHAFIEGAYSIGTTVREQHGDLASQVTVPEEKKS